MPGKIGKLESILVFAHQYLRNSKKLDAVLDFQPIVGKLASQHKIKSVSKSGGSREHYLWEKSMRLSRYEMNNVSHNDQQPRIRKLYWQCAFNNIELEKEED